MDVKDQKENPPKQTKKDLYIKFLKSKNPEIELICKNCKNLFEKLIKKCKQSYYFNLLGKHKTMQNNDGRFWKNHR